MRTSGRAIMHKSEWIQVGERGILSKCCWTVNKGESVLPSLAVCPQNKTSCNTCLNVPVAFTGCGLLSWAASVSLYGFLLVFIAISVNRISSKSQPLEKFQSMYWTIRYYRQSYGQLQHLTSNVLFLINIRLEELTQNHRHISGQLVLGEMQLQTCRQNILSFWDI